MGRPLILIAVLVVLHFFAILATIWTLPTLLFYAVVWLFIKNKEEISTNRALHILVWFPRWLFVTLVFPSWLAQQALLGYLLYAYAAVPFWVAIVAPIASTIVSVIGLVYTQTSRLKHFTPKMRLTDDGFFPCFGTAQLDFGAFLSLIISICGVIRIPSLLMSLGEGLDNYRKQLYKELLFTFLDLICFPLFLILVILVPWRIPKTWHHWREALGNNNDAFQFLNKASIRGILFKEVGNGFLDVLIFTLGFFSCLILAPWRFPGIVVKVHSKPTINQKRTVIRKAFPKCMADFLVAIPCILVVVTLYRVPNLIWSMSKEKKKSERRIAALLQFGFLLLDLVTIFFVIIMLPSMYRIILAIRVMRRKNKTDFALWKTESPQVQARLCQHFGKLIIDIPFLFCGLLCHIFFWRAFFFWRSVYRRTQKPQNNVLTAKFMRMKVAMHAGLIFVDIFVDSPLVLAALIACLNPFRAYKMYQGLSEAGLTRGEKRIVALQQIGLFLLDIPTALGALIIFVTVYRIKPTLEGWQRLTKSETQVSAPANDGLEDNPQPIKRPLSWHTVVGKQLALLALDLPFPVLMILTLWRMPWLIKKLIYACDTAMERRVEVLKTLWSVVKDVPCAILFLLMVITVWRIPSIIGLFKMQIPPDKEHVYFLRVFKEWLIDIPFIILGIFACVSLWRAPFLIKKIIFMEDANPDNIAWNRRGLAALYCLYLFADMYLVLSTVIIVGTVFRIFSWITTMKAQAPSYFIKEERLRAEFHHTNFVLRHNSLHLLIILMDLFTLLQLLMVISTILHVPSLCQRMHKLSLIRYRTKAIRRSHKQMAKSVSGEITISDIEVQQKDGQEVVVVKDEVILQEDERVEVEAAVPAVKAEQAVIMAPHLARDLKEATNLMEMELQEHISPTYFRAVIAHECMDGLKDFHHIVHLPFKLLGTLFLPIHLVMKYRTKSYQRTKNGEVFAFEKVLNEDGKPVKNSSLSFLAAPMVFMHYLAAPRMDFWGMDKFFWINLFGLVFVLPNELALIPVLINSAFIFIVTFACPLWEKQRKMLGWYGLGSAPGGIFTIVETVITVFQLLAVPAFIFLQLLLLILPIIIASSFFPTTLPTFDTLWHQFFTSAEFWNDRVGKFPWYVWLIQGYWAVTMTCCWHMTHLHAKKFYDLWNPLTAYLWLIQRVLAGTVWRVYQLLLAKPTQWSYLNRRTCGCAGELLMFPIFIVWAYWSVALPFIFFRNYYVFIATGIISIFLTWRAYGIIKANWRTLPTKEELNRPVCQIRQVAVKFPETGGLRIVIRGTKPRDLTPEIVRLHLDDKEFWRTMSGVFGGAVTVVKMMFPLQLTPDYLNAKDFVPNSDKFVASITNGQRKVKHDVIMKNLKKIVERGDPEFELVLEHGVKQSGSYQKKAIICRLKMKISQMIESSEKDTPLYQDPEFQDEVQVQVEEPVQHIPFNPDHIEIPVDQDQFQEYDFSHQERDPDFQAQVENDVPVVQDENDEFEKKVAKIMDFTGTDRDGATKALFDHQGNEEAAIGALLDA